MPRDAAPPRGIAARVDALNARAAGLAPLDVLALAIDEAAPGRIALVSSFGAESAVLLHMVARLDPALPVLFVDTGKLFAETLAYRGDLAARLGLRDLRRVAPRPEDLAADDPVGRLHAASTDACCALRKTAPLDAALAGFDAWISGRKRFQAATRAALDAFEIEEGTGRVKVNPLAFWGPEDLRGYMQAQDLPPHPLVAQGYPSIGCAPCTSRVAPGEDPRAGRWRGEAKVECGIHVVGGRLVRAGAAPAAAGTRAENIPAGEARG